MNGKTRISIRTLVALSLIGLCAGITAASEPGQLLVWADASRTPVIESVAQAFEEEYGVPVEVQELPFGNIRDQLGVAGPAGEGPDILIGAHDWLGQLVNNGLVKRLSFMQDLRGSFVDVSIDAFTYEGSMYGVPYATEAIALIYNRDLVSSPPSTFDEVIEIARELTNAENDEYGFLTHIPTPDAYHSYPFLSAYGGYVFGEAADGTREPCDIGLATDGAIEGAQLIDFLIEEGLVPASTDYQTMTSLFNDGQAAMIMTGPWAIGGAQEAGINVGVAPIPTMDGNTPQPFVGVQGFMVSQHTENRALSTVFLNEFIATQETMLNLYEADPRNPAYRPALDQVSSDPIVNAFSESAANGSPMPAIPEMASVWSAWNDALSLIVNQDSEPDEALPNAVERIRQTLGCE